MFTVIIKGQKQKNKLLQKFRKNKFIYEEMEILSCKYDLITCQTDVIPWLKISKYIHLTRPVILQDFQDKIDGIKLFNSDKLQKRIVLNSAINYIKTNHPNMVSFVDENCEFTDEITKLLKYSRQIRIITNNREDYTDFAYELLKKTGASILISSDINSAKNSEVVVIPTQLNSKVVFAGNVTVFAVNKLNIGSGNVKTSMSVTYPYELLQQVPKGISPNTFFSAVYENNPQCQLNELMVE